MSTIIIITPPGDGDSGARSTEPTGAAPPQPYDEARGLIDLAEAAGSKVRVVEA